MNEQTFSDAGTALATLERTHPAYPAVAYLAALAPGGRGGVVGVLRRVAAYYGRTLGEVRWGELRYPDVLDVRRRMVEDGAAPATANLALAALRGVARESWRAGLLPREEYDRIRDVPRVRGSRLPAGRAATGGELAALAAAPARDPAVAGRRDAALVVRGKGNRERRVFLAAGALFTVLHVTLVLVVHFRENIANIVLGRPGNVGLAVAIAIVALLLVLGLYIWTSWYSLRHKRRVQIALDAIEAPFRSLALHHLASGQHYRASAISPYLWVNGAPPQGAESPEFSALAADGFRDWRLEVGGLVARPLSLSLAELRALPGQVQITKHVCVQGWSGVGKWQGVSVAEILARCEPLPEARYLKFTSYGLDQFTYGGKPRRPFYEVLDLLLATHPQTILAYELNDAPLPLAHGAPLRLRVETQLGYKMVKYLRAIELVAEYRTSGDGQGGSREDTMFYGRGAEI